MGYTNGMCTNENVSEKWAYVVGGAQRWSLMNEISARCRRTDF